MERVLIVGSGPAAAGAALALTVQACDPLLSTLDFAWSLN